MAKLKQANLDRFEERHASGPITDIQNLLGIPQSEGVRNHFNMAKRNQLNSDRVEESHASGPISDVQDPTEIGLTASSNFSRHVEMQSDGGRYQAELSLYTEEDQAILRLERIHQVFLAILEAIQGDKTLHQKNLVRVILTSPEGLVEYVFEMQIMHQYTLSGGTEGAFVWDDSEGVLMNLLKDQVVGPNRFTDRTSRVLPHIRQAHSVEEKISLPSSITSLIWFVFDKTDQRDVLGVLVAEFFG